MIKILRCLNLCQEDVMSKDEEKRPQYEIIIDKLQKAFGAVAKATTWSDFKIQEKVIHALLDCLEKIHIPEEHHSWVIRRLQQIEEGVKDGLMTTASNMCARQLAEENKTGKK